jgi:hypothetical protein
VVSVDDGLIGHNFSLFAADDAEGHDHPAARSARGDLALDVAAAEQASRRRLCDHVQAATMIAR